MKRSVAILLTVVVASLAVGAESVLRIVAPGATGMNTDTDASDLRPTDARLLFNTNITDQPGVLTNRWGNKSYGTNARAMSVAVGVYHEMTGWKTVFGVCPGGIVRSGKYRRLGDTTTTLTTVAVGTTDTTVGVMRYSAKYGAAVNSDSVNWWWLDYRGDNDFCDGTGLGKIYANDAAPVAIMTSVSAFANYDSVGDSVVTDTFSVVDTNIECYGWWWPQTCDTMIDTIIWAESDTVPLSELLVRTDTLVYSPRMLPLSPTVPGSPAIYALNNIDKSVTGFFRYAVSFQFGDASRVGGRGPYTNIVQVASGAIVLTDLPRFAWRDLYGTVADDTTHLIIWREDIGRGGGLRPIDSIRFANVDTVVYIDTIAGMPDTSAYYDSAVYPWIKPGAPQFGGYVTGTVRGGLGYVAVSYLDTLLGIESAVGPKISSFVNSRLWQIVVPVVGPWNAVRVYLSVLDTNIVGYGDSSVMWAFKDLPVPPGNYREVFCVIGNMADTVLVDTGGVIDETGNTLQRPPYLSHLSTTLDDIEFFDEVLYGIGDPEFPSRLYFSGDHYEDWLPTNSYDIAPDDNDKLVALEKIPLGTEEGLLAFKRRSTWLITGSTVTDMTFNNGQLWQSSSGTQTVSCFSRSMGAISRDLVIKRGDAVYLVTNDLRCVRISGTRVDTISNGVWSEFKSIMTDTSVYVAPSQRGRQLAASSVSPASVYCKAMLKDDQILFLNQNNFTGMAWNVVSETWSVVQYSFADVPTGTFKYDTVSTPDLFGDDNDLFYFDGAALPFYVTNDTLHTDTVGGPVTMKYRTPDIIVPNTMIWLRSLTLGMTLSGPMDVQVLVTSNRGDTLATRLVTGSSNEDIMIGFAPHAAAGLRIEVSAINDTGSFALYELIPDIVSIGQLQRK